MKRSVRWILAVLAIVLLSFGVRKVAKSHARRKREAGYQSTLNSYSQALKPGMTRKEVENYLREKNLEFRQMCCVDFREGQKVPWDDLVKIGEEDAPWYCSSNNVYVVFQFTKDLQFKGMWRADDLDHLEAVTIYRSLETCL